MGKTTSTARRLRAALWELKKATMFSDADRVLLFVSRCTDALKVDVESIRAKPNLSKNDWRKLHSNLLRGRVLKALAQLGIQGDASALKSLEKDYGPLMIMSTAGRGRPPKLPAREQLEVERQALGANSSAVGKLARKYRATAAAVRNRLKNNSK